MSTPVLDLLVRMRAAGLPKPEAEWKFHPTRRWRFDLAYPAIQLAIEVEGGVYARRGAKRCPACGQTPPGRHATGTGMSEDCHKYSEAAVLGWRILRVTPAMITCGTALALIRRALSTPSGERSA
jgi:hypothetical protein